MPPGGEGGSVEGGDEGVTGVRRCGADLGAAPDSAGPTPDTAPLGVRATSPQSGWARQRAQGEQKSREAPPYPTRAEGMDGRMLPRKR